MSGPVPPMLTRAGDEADPIAVPALRSMVVVDARLARPDMRAAAQRIYAAFEATFGERATVCALQFGAQDGRLVLVTPERLAAARDFLAGEASERGRVLRYGRTFEDDVDPSVPFTSIADDGRFTTIRHEFAVEDPHARAALDGVIEAVRDLPVLWGAQGLGFFLPPHIEGLANYLPQSHRRYRAALEIAPEMVLEGLDRERSFHRWKAGEEPGIGDVGWRTLVGRAFHERVPGAPAALDTVADVTFRTMPRFWMVQAGDEPIWGDVNRDEDVSAYRAVASALAPIAFPLGAARAFAFGGDAYDLEQAERVEGYFTRLLDASKP